MRKVHFLKHLPREKAAQDKAAQEDKLAQEKAAQDKLARERVAQEQAAQETLAREMAAPEKLDGGGKDPDPGPLSSSSALPLRHEEPGWNSAAEHAEPPVAHRARRPTLSTKKVLPFWASVVLALLAAAKSASCT